MLKIQNNPFLLLTTTHLGPLIIGGPYLLEAWLDLGFYFISILYVYLNNETNK